MAYQDDYYNRNQYASPPRPQQFIEPNESTFNPYDNAQPHATYDQGGYDTSGYGAYRDDPSGNAKELRGVNAYDGDDVPPPRPAGPYSARKMRQWRYDHQGNLWTRGSRVRCCGRFFCCTVMIAIFLIVSILLTLALWIRPPSVLVGDPTLANVTNPISISTDSITVDMDVAISVNNPNFLSVDFSEIKADLFYPLNGNNTPIGGGVKKHVDIKSNTQTNFTLPLNITYDESSDPQFKILEDIASKCGLLPGSTKEDINIKYQIELKFTVLVVPISPTISGSFSLACPVDASALEPLLKGAGIDLNSLFATVAGSSSLKSIIAQLGSSALSFFGL